MVIMRPITLDDLDQLVALTSLAGYGLTTLPKDGKLLERRIRDSLHGFGTMDDPRVRGETYLFVMEELSNGRIIGISGIESKIGGFEPFYSYRIKTSVHESEMLKVRKDVHTLHLVTEHNGPCEVCSLFLAPDQRSGGNGRLLSLARFVFMAEHPQMFDPMVIAEMRGVIDERGRSVFWDALGRHFFDVDFPTANYLSAVDKRFIADLMPKHPIYIPILPPEAQAVIGRVHELTRPALHMLEREGFRDSGLVDIFEAGPIVTCSLDEIRAVRDSHCVELAEVSDGPIDAPEQVIARLNGEFRACKGPVENLSAGVRITAEAARALNIEQGQNVRTVPLHPVRTEPQTS